MHRPEVRLKPFDSPSPARREAAREAAEARAAAKAAAKEAAGGADAPLDLPPLLKISTVARLLDVSKKRIYFMIEEGKLECVRLGPRLTRVRTASLRAVMQRRLEPGA